MAPTADNAVFVDTNILVYASFPGGPFYNAARTRLNEFEAAGTMLWISRQVLREFLAVCSRPGAVLPLPTSDALAQAVRQFEAAFQIADEDGAVTTLLLDLLKSHTIQGKQIHDANIVATMRRYRIRRLLTNNPGDFARYAAGVELVHLIG